MTESTMNQQVVMTPKCKTATSTTLMIERRAVRETDDKLHVAGGQHSGIIINKEAIGKGISSYTYYYHLSTTLD